MEAAGECSVSQGLVNGVGLDDFGMLSRVISVSILCEGLRNRNN